MKKKKWHLLAIRLPEDDYRRLQGHAVRLRLVDANDRPIVAGILRDAVKNEVDRLDAASAREREVDRRIV